MIEESGNKRKTMAEKRQLFIEMRESLCVSGILVNMDGRVFFPFFFFSFFLIKSQLSSVRSSVLQALEREEWVVKNHGVGGPQARVCILIGLT